MLRWLDQLSEANQHTIAALGAVSTFAAVVVSLVLALIAQRSSRTRIKCRAELCFIYHPSLEGRPGPEYVTVSIRNVGLMPAIIPMSFFHWKLPFHRGYWLAQPWDSGQQDRWVPQRIYPAEIRPRASMTFYLSEIGVFRTTLAETLQQVRYLRWRIRFLKAIVRTDDGKLFKVKIDKAIRRELAKIERSAKAVGHL